MVDANLFERNETMNAPVKQGLVEHREPAQVAAMHSDTAALMAVISQASRDPSTDVTKLEKLLDMYERLEDRSAKAAYYSALSEMQDELPSIVERGEIKIGGNNSPGQKYALWEDVNKAIKPILSKHGFALSFRTGNADGKIIVTGVLSHRGGHSEETTMQLPSDTSGSKNAVQAVGSSTSYGKRYTASALLNLTSGGEDDDGQRSLGGEISEDECDKIFGLIKSTKADTRKFCKRFNIASVPDLLKKDYPLAIEMLNTKAKAVNADASK